MLNLKNKEQYTYFSKKAFQYIDRTSQLKKSNIVYFISDKFRSFISKTAVFQRAFNSLEQKDDTLHRFLR